MDIKNIKKNYMCTYTNMYIYLYTHASTYKKHVYKTIVVYTCVPMH